MTSAVLEPPAKPQPPEEPAAPAAKRVDPAKLDELRAAFRAAFMPEPPADLMDRARAYLQEVLAAEGKLGADAWSEKLDEAVENVRALVPEPRRQSAFRDHRAAFQVRHSAAYLAAHTTGLTLYRQEREAGRHTTLMQCLETAFTACRLPKEELRK